uniref:Uncharacterized protein n=1 Tax=Arundo donax TaxID=35708 RepID=A0A0A9H434_ARUDO
MPFPHPPRIWLQFLGELLLYMHLRCAIQSS